MFASLSKNKCTRISSYITTLHLYLEDPCHLRSYKTALKAFCICLNRRERLASEADVLGRKAVHRRIMGRTWSGSWPHEASKAPSLRRWYVILIPRITPCQTVMYDLWQFNMILCDVMSHVGHWLLPFLKETDACSGFCSVRSIHMCHMGKHRVNKKSVAIAKRIDLTSTFVKDLSTGRLSSRHSNRPEPAKTVENGAKRDTVETQIKYYRLRKTLEDPIKTLEGHWQTLKKQQSFTNRVICRPFSKPLRDRRERHLRFENKKVPLKRFHWGFFSTAFCSVCWM